jgi:hypothetical protein
MNLGTNFFHILYNIIGYDRSEEYYIILLGMIEVKNIEEAKLFFKSSVVLLLFFIFKERKYW